MLKKPKTIEEWRKERLRKAKQEKGFILIPMELWNGEAFHALSKAEKLILLECLSQLRYAPGGKKKRRQDTQGSVVSLRPRLPAEWRGIRTAYQVPAGARHQRRGHDSPCKEALGRTRIHGCSHARVFCQGGQIPLLGQMAYLQLIGLDLGTGRAAL